MLSFLYRYFSGNMRVRIVIDQFKVFILEIEYVLYIRIYFHLRKCRGSRLSWSLTCSQVVQIDMCISQGMYKISGFQSRNLGYHLQEQCVRCDIERYSQKNIRAALVKLQTESSVGYIKLKECMARRQIHVVQIADVPGTHYDTA